MFVCVCVCLLVGEIGENSEQYQMCRTHQTFQVNLHLSQTTSSLVFFPLKFYPPFSVQMIHHYRTHNVSVVNIFFG